MCGRRRHSHRFSLGARTRRSHTEDTMNIEEHVPFSSLTTMKTGGVARYVATVLNEADIDPVVKFARDMGLPIIPLGFGSNILAPDENVEAVFLRMGNEFTLERLEENKDSVSVTAFGGFSWDAFVEEAVERGWWGIENLSGIPGTVGAAAVQNIGAYGMVLSETVERITAYDLKIGDYRKLVSLSNAECKFGYRTSIFKTDSDRYFITRVRFTLSKKPRPKLSYKDLAQRFKEEVSPSLGEIRRAVLDIRKEKFPPLEEYGTAGSFFMNPIVGEKEALELTQRFPGMPTFPMPEGGVKVPLAWILDKVLNLKGEARGKAFLWEKQPLVVAVEHGGETREVVELARAVKLLVKEKTGITILPEVRILQNENKI